MDWVGELSEQILYDEGEGDIDEEEYDKRRG